jgi:hypothetical protein
VTTEEAIVRLARDGDDEPALIAIAENNESTLRAAIERYFSGPIREKALNSLLTRLPWHAKYFVLGHHDADQWIEHCAKLESRRLWKEAENLFAAPEHRTERYYYH